MSVKKEQLNAALIQLRADVEAGTIPRIEYGICQNVRGLLRLADTKDFFPQILALCSGWPEHSGNLEFPVPHAGYEPSWAYANEDRFRSFPKWKGEYGAARLKLLDYLIEKTS